MRVGIVGGSIAGCAAAALLHRAGHDVTVFERSESGLVSRGAGILMVSAVWRDLTARGLLDAAVPACRVGYQRIVTRDAWTAGQRWLGDVQVGSVLFNWADLYQSLRRRVPDGRYRGGVAVERIEATPQGTTLQLAGGGGSEDFDLVVCADGYRSRGRGLVDPGAAPYYRGIVLWRGLISECDIGGGALDGSDLLRPVYEGGHGIAYYVPGPGQGAEPGDRLLMWGYYLQVPESDLASVLVGLGAVREGAPGREGGAGVPPCEPAALSPVRAGAAERQLVHPGRLLLRAAQLCPRPPTTGSPRPTPD